MASQMKISFGFSKVSKQPSLNVIKKEKCENEIQFIDCLEENSIKLVNENEKRDETLVIPLKNGSVLRDKIIESCKVREKKIDNNRSKNEEYQDRNKDEPLTLDELAAKEILEDLNKQNKDDENERKLTEIPLSDINLEGEVESTIDDYNDVPINEFGLALLRGMGWQPGKGIGKNGKIVKPIETVLRPKGMALGADKAFKKPMQHSSSKEDLIMKVSAPIKVLSGPYKDMYGKIESFNDLMGRVLIRLTLRSEIVSVNENMVQLVTLSEYNKNSKVMNLKDFNDFQDKKEHEKEKRSNSNSVYEEKHKQKSFSHKNDYSRRESSESRRHSEKRNRHKSKSPSDRSYRKDKYEKSQSSSYHKTSSKSHVSKSRHRKDKECR